MTPLEREMLDLAAALSELPASAEREIALRSLRHARSLLDRQLETAVDALARSKRFYQQASANSIRERKSA